MKFLKIAGAFLILSFLTLHIYIANTPPNCSMMKDEANLRTLATALKLFYLDTGRFPSNQEGLNLLVGAEEGISIEGYKSGGYIEELPRDNNQGNAYHYIIYQQSDGAEVAVVWTYGADELPGGDERNKDSYRYLVSNEISQSYKIENGFK